MVTEELVEYVQSEIKIGASNDTIKNALRGSGWEEMDINEVFAKVTMPQVVSQSSETSEIISPVTEVSYVQQSAPSNKIGLAIAFFVVLPLVVLGISYIVLIRMKTGNVANIDVPTEIAKANDGQILPVVIENDAEPLATSTAPVVEQKQIVTEIKATSTQAKIPSSKSDPVIEPVVVDKKPATSTNLTPTTDSAVSIIKEMYIKIRVEMDSLETMIDMESITMKYGSKAQVAKLSPENLAKTNALPKDFTNSLIALLKNPPSNIITISSVEVKGTTATLYAVSTFKGSTKGKATFLLEGGIWKLDHESWGE